MPYGEDITINVGDAVRIHPNYENYKFKKLKYGATYFVEATDKFNGKVNTLRQEDGSLVQLKMDKRYFEHVGKEKVMERDYELFIGDVVLVTTGGYGLVDEDECKYVEVVGKGSYFGDPGVEVKPYQCELETTKGCGSIGDQGIIGYESFGNNPMILLNTLEEPKENPFNPSLETRKNGKNKMELVETGFPNAFLALGEVMTWAADHKGYLPGDWKELPDAKNSLLAAAARHRVKRLAGQAEDDESGLPHLYHEAFNVMAQLELLITGKL